MKAIVQHTYGDPIDVLALHDVDPPAPQPREAVVGMRAAGVNAHPQVHREMAMTMGASKQVQVHSATETPERLRYLDELLRAGQLTPVMDRTFDLADAPAALQYLLEGHTQGKSVVVC